MFACPLTGALSDLVGRKTMALVNCVSVICGNLLLSQSTQLWHVFVGFMIIGVSLAFFWPLVLAWIGDIHSSRQLPRTTAVFNICWSSGMMIGTLVGGALFSLATFAPFVCAAGVAFVAFAALIALPDPAKGLTDASKAIHKVKRPFHSILIVAWINNLMLLMA